MAAVPPPLDADALRAALAGTAFADVRVVAETGSTNADVAALARAGAPGGLVLGDDDHALGRARAGEGVVLSLIHI